MGWLSTATPNPSPSTAGCQGARCCQSREGSIPWDISVQSPEMQQKKDARRQPPPGETPQPPALGHHLAPGAPTSPPPYGGALDPTPLPTPHICTHTPPYFLPTPYKTTQPSHQEHPKPPAPPQTPQPGRARAHLLSGSPVCLPKVFAAGGTCFDTISSAKEAAHLA